MKISATLSACEQIGIDSFRDRHITKIFETSNTFDDVLNWAKSLDPRNRLSDVLIAEVVD